MFQVEIPEPVYAAVEVPLTEVRRLDNIIRENGQLVAVKNITGGPKYVTLWDENEKVIVRQPHTHRVVVKRETPESRRARSNAEIEQWTHDAIVKHIESFTPNARTKAALAKIEETVEKGWFFSSFNLDELIIARAEDEVFDRFIHVAREALKENPDVNLSELLENYKKSLTNDLVTWSDGVSRSTSQGSNLLEDARRGAISKFIRGSSRLYV